MDRGCGVTGPERRHGFWVSSENDETFEEGGRLSLGYGRRLWCGRFTIEIHF